MREVGGVRVLDGQRRRRRRPDSMMWEATDASIGDTSGENVAPGAALAGPPIHGMCRTGMFMGGLSSMSPFARPVVPNCRIGREQKLHQVAPR